MIKTLKPGSPGKAHTFRTSKRELKTNLRAVPETSGAEYRAELRTLFTDWRSSWGEAIRFQHGGSDLLAGITVAAVALPLNLALAVASGLPPTAGLLAGAIGGGVVAIFGGAPLQVSGPAAALNVMVFALAHDFGASGVAAAALCVGVIGLILAFALAGKLAKYVPEAVLAGFTTGVGLKLLDNQLPELLGFDYTVLELASMLHRPTWLQEVSWLAVVCGLFVALLVTSTKRFKRFPAALVGVAIVTALSIYLNWNIKRVGAIPNILPTPSFPDFPLARWVELLPKMIPLGLLAAVESLLSAQALDRLSNAKTPHNPNLELFGQGLGNIASGFFGGMPVTGVVVRSSVNVQSGGKTRLASLIHALILLFSVLYLGDLIEQIPLAGLAGLLCVIGLRLVEIGTLIELMRKHKVEAISFLVAAGGTVSGHLVSGLVGGGLIHLVHWYLTRTRRHAEELKTTQQKHGIRAVLSRDRADARVPGHYEASPGSENWLGHVRDRAHLARSAFVHGHASVIGRVVVGENVHVAADSSIRADEGTPFFIGANSNVQDGVVMHALKEKWVNVAGEQWAIYVGKNVSLAHQALVHGPCYIGDNSFVGFKAIVHDSVVGSHCYIGIGAVVVGVEIPDGRYVPHGAIIDTADKVDGLPRVTDAHMHFNEDVVDVNRGLAAAYRASEQQPGPRAIPDATEAPVARTRPPRSPDRF